MKIHEKRGVRGEEIALERNWNFFIFPGGTDPGWYYDSWKIEVSLEFENSTWKSWNFHERKELHLAFELFQFNKL